MARAKGTRGSRWHERVTRRQFLHKTALAGAGLAAAVVGCGGGEEQAATPSAGTPAPAVLRGTELKILTWGHFVPRYDREWFDSFVQAWGDANGVRVTVDHIAAAEIRSRAVAEISAGAGHDIIQFNFPPADLEPNLLDLTDVVREAERRFGAQIPLATKSSFNPKTGVVFGLVKGWGIDAGCYRRSMWERVGLANGPTTWQELLEGGRRIKREQGVQVGLGLSPAIDSEFSSLSVLWSFGASVQDERENVVINSSRTVEAVEFMAQLFRDAMTPEVFGWTPPSNNQALVAGTASYILNPYTAYRTAQKERPEVAVDIFFRPALRGPTGVALASAGDVHVMVVPKFSRNPAAAREFLLHYLANMDQAVWYSELFELPAFPDAPLLSGDRGYPPVQGARTIRDLINAWFDNDPFRLDREERGKLGPLKDADRWTVAVGHPGPTNAAQGEVFSTFLVTQMFAKAARGELSPRDAVADAERQIVAIYRKWRERGLVGGN